MTLQEFFIHNNIERIRKYKDYILSVVLKNSNDWLLEYKKSQVKCLDANCDENPQEADYFIDIYQEEVYNYELIDYNVVGSTIVSIMSIWEQQLYDFIKGNKVKDTFTAISKFYLKHYGIDITHYDEDEFVNKDDFRYKILEYKNLANTIKHGKGGSLKFLEDNSSRFVKIDNHCYTNDYYEQIKSVSVILNYYHNDLEECCNLLIQFWSAVRRSLSEDTNENNK